MIVVLDHYMFVEFFQCISFFFTFLQYELCTITNHEVLLIDSEQFSLFVTVIRIEEQCQILADIIFVKCDSISYDILIYRFNVE